MQGHQNQIAPIELYNPQDDDGEQSTWGQCVCCGEDAQTYGVCLACVNTDCDPSFDVACSRTGEIDPLDLSCPDTAADIIDRVYE